MQSIQSEGGTHDKDVEQVHPSPSAISTVSAISTDPAIDSAEIDEDGAEGKSAEKKKKKQKRQVSIHFGIDDNTTLQPGSDVPVPGAGEALKVSKRNSGGTMPGVRRTQQRQKMFSRSSQSSTASCEQFEDKLQPEDVGLAFGIRAASDFRKEADDKLPWDVYTKHLHGLSNIFPESLEDLRDSGLISRTLSGRPGTFAGRQLYRTIRFISSVFGAPIRNGRPREMRYSATCLLAVRIQLFLSYSAIASCIFVLGSISVEPACRHGDRTVLPLLSLVNSTLYLLIALPSRGFFSRVDFRHGQELTDCHDVLLSHLRSPSLYLDIISVIGYAAEIYHAFEPDCSGPLPTVAQGIMLLQLLKFWRVVLPEEDSDKTHSGFWQGIGKLLFYLMAFSHVTACTLLTLGNIERDRGGDSWLNNDSTHNLDVNHCTVRYTEAVYFSIIGLSSVGYGDSLITPYEHGLNCFVLLVSQLFAAKVCADLTWLTSMYNQHEAQLHERKRSLCLALDKMGVPKVLVKRVLAFQSYEDTMHTDNMEKETFAGLSRNLMEELRLCTYRKLVLQAPFLREQPTEVISFIVNCLKDEVYLPSDFIIRAGDRTRELYFNRRGEARAYLGSHPPVWGQSAEVAIIKAGSYFGELAMLTGIPRGSYVMATSYCICSVLPYSAVENLVERHPEAFTSLVQAMVKMYNLKPDSSWESLAQRMQKKLCIVDDSAAFTWLKSHDEHPEVDDLYAKAFDLALQKLKVNHLDRRIFWSELDKDASGGISFEEFKGKLNFDATQRSSYMQVPPHSHSETWQNSPMFSERSTMDSRLSSAMPSPLSAMSTPMHLPGGMCSYEHGNGSVRGSVMSEGPTHVSPPGSLRASTISVTENGRSSTVNRSSTLDSSGIGMHRENRDSQLSHHMQALPERSTLSQLEDRAILGTLAALLTENQRLIQEVQKLHSK
jgi:CRP-like cAMP-binding protein